MKEIVCDLLLSLGEQKEVVWKIIMFFILTLYIFLVYQFFKSQKKEHINSLTTLVFICCTFFTLTFLRLPELTLFQNYADESEWVVQANEFTHDPINWIIDFLPRQFGRVFSIVPLSVMKIFSDKIGFEEVRIFSLFLLSLFLVFLFKYLLLKFKPITSLVSYFAFFVLFSVFDADIYVAYTSQYPAISALMITLFLFEVSINSKNFKAYLFIAGLLISLNPFIKEQSFFLSAALFCSYSFLLISKRSFMRLSFLVAGSLFGIFLMILPFIVFNLWKDLFSYFELLKNYATNPIGHAHANFIQKIYLFVQLIFNKQIRLMSLIALTSSLFVIFNILRKNNYLKINNNEFYFSIFIFLITCLTVYYPGNFFLHYSIYFILPLGLLFPYFIEIIYATLKNNIYSGYVITLSLFALFIFKIINPFYSFSRVDMNCRIDFYNVFSKELIQMKKSDDDRLIIWGWYNSYYEETGLLMGGRRLYPQEVLMNYTSKNDVIDEYVEDFKKFKPRFIVEAIGPDKFVFNDTASQSMRHFKKIYSYVKDNYSIKSKKRNEILYVRNE
jgi:hypothetical protein